MKIAPKNRVQRTFVAGAAALTLLASTGCSAINEQATTKSYSASDGIVTNVGPVGLRNLMVIAESADSAGRILGTAVNSSDSPVQLTLNGPDSTATVTVPADGQIRFEDDENETVVESPGAAPGALVDVTVQVNNESAEIQVPVHDGTLPEYSSYLPEPEPSATEDPAAAEDAAEPASPAAAPDQVSPAEAGSH